MYLLYCIYSIYTDTIYVWAPRRPQGQRKLGQLCAISVLHIFASMCKHLHAYMHTHTYITRSRSHTHACKLCEHAKNNQKRDAIKTQRNRKSYHKNRHTKNTTMDKLQNVYGYHQQQQQPKHNRDSDKENRTADGRNKTTICKQKKKPNKHREKLQIKQIYKLHQYIHTRTHTFTYIQWLTAYSTHYFFNA